MTAVGEPTLVGATETTISTDFALLHVVQEGCGGQAETQVFATSLPGEIALRCGTKFAMPTVRLERWDSQPPPVAGLWEDFDEIPFREREDRGALVITGFDPEHPEEPRLEVGGLGRARVQIFARGRHVAAYGDGLGDQPEDWLLRLWPDPDYHDALWGGPRSIKGLVENELPLSGGRAYVSAAEVSHILRWSPPGDRQPSVRQIADRLLMSRLSVRQGLETIAWLVTRRQEPDPFPDGLPSDDDAPVRFVRPPGHGFVYDANPETP